MKLNEALSLTLKHYEYSRSFYKMREARTEANMAIRKSCNNGVVVKRKLESALEYYAFRVEFKNDKYAISVLRYLKVVLNRM